MFLGTFVWTVAAAVLAGLLLLGLTAVLFPHIIGVGYETTSKALTGELTLAEAMVFAVIKTAAVATTIAGRMGGGVFSPSLMLGALTGLAFGIIATGLLPEISGRPTLYALAGMGAVAAAVLGAPISTTLIVFELTGDWQTGLAVMVSVSLSTAVASRLVHRSYFLTQLERRGIHLAAGPQAYLLAMFRVSTLLGTTHNLGSGTRSPGMPYRSGPTRTATSFHSASRTSRSYSPGPMRMPHRSVAFPCASASMNITRLPRSASPIAICIATVVLPTPPFSFTSAIVFIFFTLPVDLI